MRGWTLGTAFILIPISIFIFLLFSYASYNRTIFSAIPITLLLPGVITLTIGSIGFLTFNKRKKSLSKKGDMFKDEDAQNLIPPAQYSGPKIFTPTSGLTFCKICKMKFYRNEEYYQCAICTAEFHTKHLMDWLTIKNECPVCKNKYI